MVTQNWPIISFKYLREPSNTETGNTSVLSNQLHRQLISSQYRPLIKTLFLYAKTAGIPIIRQTIFSYF